MQVARSGNHAWAVREESERGREDRLLAVHVAAALERSWRTYGSPRIQAELRDECLRVGRGAYGADHARKWPRRTQEEGLPHGAGLVRARQDLAEQARAQVRRAGPNRKWVTDVKSVRTGTGTGWLYVAPVIDLFLRRAVGCAMSATQDVNLSLAAPASALEAPGNPRDVVVHSDRGGISGSDEYVRKADKHRLRRSMSRTGNPWDNAAIESFFSPLTFELLDRERYGGKDIVQRSIAEWIDDFYNAQRRHTSLRNTSPIM
jgi:putative transposase